MLIEPALAARLPLAVGVRAEPSAARRANRRPHWTPLRAGCSNRAPTWAAPWAEPKPDCVSQRTYACLARLSRPAALPISVCAARSVATKSVLQHGWRADRHAPLQPAPSACSAGLTIPCCSRHLHSRTALVTASAVGQYWLAGEWLPCCHWQVTHEFAFVTCRRQSAGERPMTAEPLVSHCLASDLRPCSAAAELRQRLRYLLAPVRWRLTPCQIWELDSRQAVPA